MAALAPFISMPSLLQLEMTLRAPGVLPPKRVTAHVIDEYPQTAVLAGIA